ncbi:hypothetical protein sscle_15g105250 [Sclerotinia sclerotiorum 1980 UF-70]|uniref:Uncharacterized protein n=1 Tax=Sclerotinia sclerotiorum (strain ATCC 18683 / 1980 / Ss-1) TaxID=665079 RepID=A0A1D9QLD5_SCLS1|nr:hypothetical protein sscle_15g105250 [Sclerotinia sclerotiorum 1980 UF-70]
MMRLQVRRIVIVAVIFSATIAYILYTQTNYVTWPHTEPNDSVIHEPSPPKTNPELKENEHKQPDEKTHGTDQDSKLLSDAASTPVPIVPPVTCPTYAEIQMMKHDPLSEGQEISLFSPCTRMSNVQSSFVRKAHWADEDNYQGS